jgi:predicted phage terminase large subunit-like protein
MKKLKKLQNLSVLVAEKEKREEKRKLSNSYYEFFKESFEILHPGLKLVDNWHIEFVCGKIQEAVTRVGKREPRKKHLIFNIPPRSLKTLMCTINLTPWAWINYPFLDFISVSYSGSLSLDHNVASRRIIQSNWYQERWSDRFKLTSDQNVKSKYDNDSYGTRECTSTGGTLTGKGANMIICDDMLNPKLAYSDTERRNTLNFVTKTLPSRFNDLDVDLLMIVEQRLHEEDTTGNSIELDPDSYEHIVIPAVLDESIRPKKIKKYYTDGLFFPKRFSKRSLESLKKKMGTREYSSQYLQRPFPDEGDYIKKAWLNENIITKADIPDNLPTYYYSDTSYGETKTSDPSGFGAWHVWDGKIILVEMFSKRLKFNDYLKEFDMFFRRTNGDKRSYFYIEPKASGLSIMQYLREKSTYNIIGDEPPKESKVVRLQYGLPVLEAGRVKLLHGTWNDKFISECIAFPNGKHDDMVDILSAIIRLSDLDGSVIVEEKELTEQELKEQEERERKELQEYRI